LIVGWTEGLRAVLAVRSVAMGFRWRWGKKQARKRRVRDAVAEAPHAVCADEDGREQDDEAEGW
jgi:predicted  nucleic acid-binding Zn-ribbon protein